MLSRIKIIEVGGDGGSRFPMEIIRSVTVFVDDYVNGIKLNEGEVHGCEKGKRHDLVLNDGEYIERANIEGGNTISVIEFNTSQRRRLKVLSGKKPSGNYSFKKFGGEGIKKCRLIGIGGCNGTKLDRITLRYIEGYTPSRVLDSNASIILETIPSNTKFTSYTDSMFKKMEAHNLILSNKISNEFEASIEGEYCAKASTTLKLSSETTSVEEMKNQLEETLKSGETIETTIGDDEIGYKYITGAKIMQTNDKVWILPQGNVIYSKMKKDNSAKVKGMYDLSQALHHDVPELGDDKKKHGIICY
jgi:hypothetical protein